MTQEALSRIWNVVGTFLFLYVISAWSHTQGGPSLGGSAIFDPRPIVSSFYALILIGPILTLLVCVGTIYAKRSKADSWYQRLPLTWMAEKDVGRIDRSDWATKIYLAFILFLFIIMPLAGTVHFSKKINKHGIVYNQALTPAQNHNLGDTLPLIGKSRHSTVLNSKDRNGELKVHLAENVHDVHYTFDENYKTDKKSDFSDACRKNVSYCKGIGWHPTISPLIMFISLLFSWGAFFALVYVLAVSQGWRKKPKRKN